MCRRHKGEPNCSCVSLFHTPFPQPSVPAGVDPLP
nr:MAG TPA: hypothetical protein [Caudoviricetes sp.]